MVAGPLLCPLSPANYSVPFKICLYPEVTRAWSRQAPSTAEGTLQPLRAGADGS